MSVLIKGGRIITAADDYVGDVYVDGERITLTGESLDVDADRVIDAPGRYVLPGCVDPHTHLDMPFGGTTTIDDITSGHTAAAFGGTTCHVDFCIQSPGQSFADPVEAWHAKREGKAIIDNGYHMAVTDLDEGGSLEALARLPEQGVTSDHGGDAAVEVGLQPLRGDGGDGSPEVVLLRGSVIVENGELVVEPGIGQFVERAAFGQELLPAAAR